MKKFFLILILFFINFSNIFAYEKNFKYDEIEFIKKYDFAIIIFEDENGIFEFKNKKYNPKFGIKFLEDFKGDKTKVKINKNFLENFKKDDTKLKNYFLIRIDDFKNIDIIKVIFEGNFSDFEKLSKQEFLETFDYSDFYDISTSSNLQSKFLKDFASDRNSKFKYLFEKIKIDQEILEFFTKKFDKKDFVNNLFIRLLENEVYNSGKNIILK